MRRQPKWERGYRSHGYWIGTERVGWIGLSCGFASRKSDGYGWYLEVAPYSEGRTKTLKAAKRAVERAWKARKP